MYLKYLISDNAQIHVLTMNVLVNLGRFASNPPDGTRAVASQVIQNRLGLHARPAAMFVRTANRHRANIWVQKNGEPVNGKSILGLMALAATKGTKLVISADGADAEKTVQELGLLIQRRFDEE
jgi:phosphocarrier protein HPr